MRLPRAAAWRRAMFAENRIGPQDLIWPLFVTEGKEVEEPVSSLPGVSRWSVDLIVARAREARDAGIPCLALFPNTPPEKRSADGKEALNPDNLMCRATKAIKDAVPDRSEEHTSELQSLMRNSYAVFCLKKKKETNK